MGGWSFCGLRGRRGCGIKGTVEVGIFKCRGLWCSRLELLGECLVFDDVRKWAALYEVEYTLRW